MMWFILQSSIKEYCKMLFHNFKMCEAHAGWGVQGIELNRFKIAEIEKQCCKGTNYLDV